MFYSLRGKLINVSNLSIAVECGGVGYKCNVTQNTLSELPAIGDDVFVYTHLNVREDAMELFGFSKLNYLRQFLELGQRLELQFCQRYRQSKLHWQ